jgi:hypothetical protein
MVLGAVKLFDGFVGSHLRSGKDVVRLMRHLARHWANNVRRRQSLDGPHGY